MTFYYLDASAWVKRYYQETGTWWVQGIFSQETKLACSALGLIEVIATLARKCKAGEIAPSSFEQKVQDLEDDWRHFIHIHLTAEAVDTAKEQARVWALRGADAIHLASALMLQRRFGDEEDQMIFVTSDQELKEVATSVGLTVSDPNEEGSSPSELREDEEKTQDDE